MNEPLKPIILDFINHKTYQPGDEGYDAALARSEKIRSEGTYTMQAWPGSPIDRGSEED